MKPKVKNVKARLAPVRSVFLGRRPDKDGPEIEQVFVLPTDAESYDRMVEQGAETLDPLCWHEYKEGECLPRGLECHPVEKVNEIQGFRQRAAISQAKKFLTSLGITRPKEATH
jgi:hypothetical protein